MSSTLALPQGWQGFVCNEPVTRHCANGCSGRGTCVRGFCHCQPPWYGIGCTSRGAFQPQGQAPSPHRLRIYMYDLPAAVAFQDGYQPGGLRRRALRS